MPHIEEPEDSGQQEGKHMNWPAVVYATLAAVFASSLTTIIIGAYMFDEMRTPRTIVMLVAGSVGLIAMVLQAGMD